MAADLVLIVHAAFIAFVIFALLATVVGWALGWGWVRNRWLRGAHLLCIGYVVLEAWLKITCPLTILENNLRLRGGQEPYGANGFIAHWLDALIFFHAPVWVFTVCYTTFGGLVVAMMFLAPPRWGKAKPRATVSASH